MYKLYYYPRNASWAPHLILQELGVKFELELVDRKLNTQKSEEYLKLNPTGRIPTLVHNEKAIFESAAIAMYLCEAHPEGNLIPPKNTQARQQCYQWLFYLTTTLQSELMVYFYPEKHTTNRESADAIKEAQETRIIEIFDVLDKQIGSRQYLVGDSFSICDPFLFMLCHWGSGLKRPPLSFPSLAKCLQLLAGRKSFQLVCDVESTSLKMYQ